MRIRDALGKRIVAIVQHPAVLHERGGKRVWEVSALVLEDGTRLVPFATETDWEPIAQILVVKKGEKSD